MNSLLQTNLQAHADLVILKECLKRFRVQNLSVDVDYYTYQSIITFLVNDQPYIVRMPIGTPQSSFDYYLKDQLPELLI